MVAIEQAKSPAESLNHYSSKEKKIQRRRLRSKALVFRVSHLVSHIRHIGIHTGNKILPAIFLK